MTPLLRDYYREFGGKDLKVFCDWLINRKDFSLDNAGSVTMDMCI